MGGASSEIQCAARAVTDACEVLFVTVREVVESCPEPGAMAMF